VKKPKTIETTKIIECKFKNAKEAMAGPGHNPTAPQPIPNKEAPKINFKSMFLLNGIEKFSANKGLFLK
jgi:hypothetical protein